MFKPVDFFRSVLWLCSQWLLEYSVNTTGIKFQRIQYIICLHHASYIDLYHCKVNK